MRVKGKWRRDRPSRDRETTYSYLPENSNRIIVPQRDPVAFRAIAFFDSLIFPFPQSRKTDGVGSER